MPCDEAWEYGLAEDAEEVEEDKVENEGQSAKNWKAVVRWQSYCHQMRVCVSCFELSVHRSESRGGTRCACSAGSNGWKPMPQGVRDAKAAQARASAQARSPSSSASPPVTPPSTRATRRQPAGPTGCKLLSASDGSTAQMYIAVPRVLHGVGRRDRWVIVRLELDSSGQAGWVGMCSHPECVSERHVRLASGIAHVSCEHVEAAKSKTFSNGGVSDGWALAIRRGELKDVTVSLDGCLAHVASGSSRWACGGLRQCESCGFYKQDVEAESRSYVSAHTNEEHEEYTGARTNEAVSEAAPVRRSSRLAGPSGLQLPQAWFLPDGWCVQQKVPAAEALDDLDVALKVLVNKRIMYNWLPPVCACPVRWPWW